MRAWFPRNALGCVSVASPRFARSALLARNGLACVCALGFGLLLVTASAVVISPLPSALGARHFAKGTVVEDRHGRPIGQLRDAEFELALPLPLAQVPVRVRNAVIASEDARFYRHRGFDPFAIGRAAWQWARRGHIVSGGSTITQQLARSVAPRPRTLFGKWRELLVALRIECELDKTAILEAYLNHVPFGPNTRGIAAAADEVFGKSVAALSLGEAAALAALPRGPSRYNPLRQPARLLARRNYVLARMLALGFAEPDAALRAANEPLVVREKRRFGRALHFLRALSQGRLAASAPALGVPARLRTTLDLELQARVEKLLDDAASPLDAVGASAAAIVVIDNASAELRAYVGSRDFFDVKSLGQNDGCLALRQPGSSLKPFVYAAALDGLGFGPTTQLLDVETTFQTPAGPFTPRNYDGRYHGLVLLRDALAASLNVPAVAVAERVGIERQLSMLHRFGFQSLSAPASHYGLALALGDGEVRLVELAVAYSALARRGQYLPLRTLEARWDVTGEAHRIAIEVPQPVIAEATAYQLLEILSDDGARASSFGRHGTLELPFAAATKTGTSSNHRDNWAVAVTHELTVAVWVGNFDGRPLLHGTSGVVGAAPLMRSVMESAMGDAPREPLVPPERLQLRRICKISGQRPNRWCPEVIEIRSVPSPKAAPEGLCTLHERASIDPQNGLLAGPGCQDAVERTVERYPEPAQQWARDVGRSIEPGADSPRCPRDRSEVPGGELSVRVPAPGARYLIDPQLPASQQRLEFEVTAHSRTAWVTYAVDGRSSGPILAPFRWQWPLSSGKHHAQVTSSCGRRVDVDFWVR